MQGDLEDVMSPDVDHIKVIEKESYHSSANQDCSSIQTFGKKMQGDMGEFKL